MKKTLFFGLMVALAIVGCKKEDPTPTPTQDLIYTGKNIIEVGAGTNFVNLEFTANKPWTLIITCDTTKTGKNIVTADKTQGAAGEQKVKLTFEDLDTGVNGTMSYVGVTTSQSEIPEEGTYFAVAYVQGNVFVFPLGNTVDMPVLGGSVSASFYTNCGYVVKKYDQFEEWAPCTVSENTINFTVSENTGYDPRQAYVKFTVEEIQVPEYDDEGKPTGKTVAATYRFYVNQAGAMQEAWSEGLTAEMALPSTHTIAKFGDKVYVANALAPSLFVFNSETGASEGTLSLASICDSYINSICADDAGNLVIAFGGNYPLTESTTYIPLKIYSVAAGKTIDATNAKKLVEYTNGFYGYGLDNIKVTGDVTTSAAISMVTAAPSDGGSYVVSWQITGGACAESTGYTAYAALPTGVAVWYSGDMVARHTTADVQGGILYMGYDSHYDLCYNPSMTGEWSHLKTIGVTGWGENLAGLDVIEWNQHKYVAYIANTFFPGWGMSSYVGVLNVDDPAAIQQVSLTEHAKVGAIFDEVNEKTGDVCAVLEGSDLVLYVVDGGNGFIKKLVYPAK